MRWLWGASCLLLLACSDKQGSGSLFDLFDGGRPTGHDGSSILPGMDAGPPGPGADALPPGADVFIPDSGRDTNGLVWEQMVLPPNTRSIDAIWGRSESEIYAGTSNGLLLRLEAGGWTDVWRDPGNFGIVAIWGTTDRLFIASRSTFHVHVGPVGTDVTSFNVGSNVRGMHGRNDQEVYLVADQTSGRGLYKYQGDAIVTIIEPTDVGTLSSVFAASDGNAYVGASGAMFRYDGSVFVPETVDWPGDWNNNERLLFNFEGIREVDGRLFAFGTQGLVFERESPNATWRRLNNPSPGAGLEAAWGYNPMEGLELYLVGQNTPDGPIVRYVQDELFRGQTAIRAALFDIWAAGPNLFYATGAVANSIDGVILRGHR